MNNTNDKTIEKKIDGVECKEFYNLMQEYRHSPVMPPTDVACAYYKIKEHIAKNYTPNTEVQKETKEGIKGFKAWTENPFTNNLNIQNNDTLGYWIEQYLNTL